jgi:signal transduction histidine kinase
MSFAPTERRRSAAWRLSAPAVLVFAVGTGAALALAYHLDLAAVHDQLDAVLTSAAADLSAEVPAVAAGDLGKWLADERLELARYFSYRRGAGPAATAVVLVVTDRRGRAVGWSGVGDPQPLLDSLAAGSASPAPRATVALRGFAKPLRAVYWQGGQRGAVAAVEAAGDDGLLGRLASTLVAVWALVTLFGTAVSVWSVRGALGRVENLTRAAGAIAHPEGGQRLPDGGGDDEIARLTGTLNGMLDRIAAGVREVRDLSQSVAHDLRSPVTVVRARLEMALTAGAGDEWRDEVAAVIEQLDRLVAVLEAALDVAEAQGGALASRRQPIDLAALCAELADLYSAVAEEQGVRLEADLPPALPAVADPHLLHRAVGNLLDNALRHAGGARRVRLAASRQADGGVAVSVEDDGRGFDPAVRERPFKRPTSRPNGNGFGLGLPLVEAVAQAHGGEATLGVSALGGASVTLTLPATDPQP